MDAVEPNHRRQIVVLRVLRLTQRRQHGRAMRVDYGVANDRIGQNELAYGGAFGHIVFNVRCDIVSTKVVEH